MIRPVMDPVERIPVPPGFHVLENGIGELEIMVKRDWCQCFCVPFVAMFDKLGIEWCQGYVHGNIRYQFGLLGELCTVL